MPSDQQVAPDGGNQGAARKRVLVVEDNPFNMKLFTAMIAAQGYQVLQAGDGPNGLEMARRAHPDLIVMDIQLPGMSGLEATSALKADDDTREIPVIATTAYALRDDEDKIWACGCDGYMAKPIAITEFIDLIEALISFGTAAPAVPGTRAARPAATSLPSNTGI